MKNTKSFAALVLAASLMTVGTTAAGFAKTETYPDGKFTDVSASEWYAAEVKNAYELGLIKGESDTAFNPEGSVTLAESITMAARAAAVYYGETIPETAGEWYTMYVDYAASKGMNVAYDDYDRAATRAEVASVFAACLPADYYAAKNDVKAVPDVSAKQTYHDAVLMLYKAGVVMGSDAYGNFRPMDNITRAECAAILNRAALPENRLQKTLDIISADDAYPLDITSGMSSSQSMSPIASGWLLDNRGGVPRTSMTEQYGALYDISTTAGTAYIRELNKVDTGRVVLHTKVTVSGESDGVFLEFRSDKDESVTRIETVGGAWTVGGTVVYPIKEGETDFTFEAVVDVDNKRASYVINGKDCGTFPFAAAEANLYNFRFATTEKSTATVTPAYCYMDVNYAVKESFSYTNGALPRGFAGGNVTVSDNTLHMAQNGSLSARFDPVSGTVAAEFEVLLPNAENMTYTLYSGVKPILTFESKDGAFLVNGGTVYDAFVPNLWYRLRFELDTDENTALVKVNGRKCAAVPFAAAATSVDSLAVTSTGNITLDDFAVFRLAEHDDYVPFPVIPKGTEEYTVGMNVCSLWQNGPSGWSVITPYDDVRPVLGYYDECLPETADWEIKYTLEHGIDFQAFCVYFNADSGVQRPTVGHLYEGFMNAKYADMTHFAVIWETANAKSPKDLDTWKADYVPYFIENFFKDPRYITVDNRPVLCVFGAESIVSRLGSKELCREALDYMEQEVKKLGFDGIVYLACGSAAESLADAGFDGAYAYNWGTWGYDLAYNKSQMTSSAKNPSMKTVPTVSVGFNNVGWAGTRHDLMTAADYKAAHEWVKSDFMPQYSTGEKWQKNFVMLSTWNEFGEGTYIFPSGLNRFGYLDVVREAYTSEKADASLNTVPTAAQAKRINRLYPQYRRLLRKNGSYAEKGVDTSLSKMMNINGNLFELNFTPQKNASSAALVAFDPSVGMDFRLGAFHLWDHDNGVLTLHFIDHTVVFTVGKNTFIADGKEKPLGFALETVDGLPVIPMDILCKEVGYTFAVTDGKIVIGTDQKAYFDELNKPKPGVWEFNNPGETGGFSSGNMGIEVNDGVMKLTSEGSDPRMNASDLLLPAAKYKELDVSLNFEYTGSLSWTQIYFLTDKDSSWNEDKAIKIFINKMSSDGKFIDYKIDLTQIPAWKDNITEIRFDPFNAAGTMQIDYIRFIADPAYSGPEPEDIRKAEEDMTFEIKNGDAEGFESGFTSTENLDIVADPDDASNNCYKVIPKSDMKMWLYVRHPVRYTPGSTYHVEFDTRLASVGTSEDLPADFAGTVIVNAVYSEPKGNDHIIRQFPVKASDGWVHLACDFTVSSDSSTRKNDQFTLYSNPANEKGVGFFFDNVVVTETAKGDPAAVSAPIGQTRDDVEILARSSAAMDNGTTEIINGDAGDVSKPNAFFSDASTAVQIVKADGRNVWLVTPPADKETYTYVRQKVVFEAGKTYKISFDAKTTSIPANINVNAVYKDPTGIGEKSAATDKNSHLPNNYNINAVEWKHCECTFTVHEDCTDRSGDQIAFFTNPVDGLGVEYMIDNVVLEEAD